MSEVLVNKVAESGIITLDLETYLPKEEIVLFDLKGFLFMELILKEKDFRAALLATDWEQYRNKYVAVTCTADAIIPFWAYMLVASYLSPVAAGFGMGNEKEMRRSIFLKRIAAIDENEYVDKRVVIKGCGDAEVGPEAYLEITKKLRPVVKSLMYGEPCSTVPVYKKKN